ncbi:MAG: glycosyltransferase family 2 protein [Candidatus Eisenbacteria bacterium]|jgi:glycosyltransferase involved in cell wall biosynthesis|nr:glycosyltransferase family 2 protein [Candidatus Eisenbacteria bacterium]
MSLSAVLIARDEAHRIERCLEALRWADEVVVVVDDASRDETEGIARRFGARVFVRAFDSFSLMRQFADEQATCEWILSVDCDEIVTPQLAAEIRAALATEHTAFRIPHLDYMFGRWIRHGGWYPQYHWRLYRRARATWARAIHERVEFEGSVGTLREPFLHFSHGRVSDFVNKMARYTTTEAEAALAAGRRTNVLRMATEPFLYFGYKYVVQGGWRDGAHGFVLASLMGCYRLLVHLKLWDLAQAQRGDRDSRTCPPRT